MIAFRSSSQTIHAVKFPDSQTLTLKTSKLLSELTPFQRDALQMALSGHIPKIVELIESWDKDARALLLQGVTHIQRLSTEQYLLAHALAQLAARFNAWRFTTVELPDELGTDRR